MAKPEKRDAGPGGSGRKFKSGRGANKKTGRAGVPPWAFFVVLALLAAGVLYFRSSSSGTGGASRGGNLPVLPAAPSAGSAAGALPSPQSRFEKLPGISLAGLSEDQEKKFLDRVNTDHCTCGCTGDTIAKCIVQDPQCQVAPAMAKRVLAEVQSAPR